MRTAQEPRINEIFEHVRASVYEARTHLLLSQCLIAGCKILKPGSICLVIHATIPAIHTEVRLFWNMHEFRSHMSASTSYEAA